MTHRPSPSRRGFTLLELLLAIAITGAISVVLFAGLSIAFNLREKAEGKLADRDTTRLAAALITEDLSAAPRPRGLIVSEFLGTDGTGDGGLDADRVSFVTAAHGLRARDGMGEFRRVEYALETDGDAEASAGNVGGRLVRLVTDNLLAVGEPEPDRQVIAERVVGLSLRYFDGNTWVDGWDSIDRDNDLPIAVEVVLTVRPQEGIDAREDEDDWFLRRVVTLPMSTRQLTDTAGGMGLDTGPQF